METITEEKLYRIARKKDSHVNTRLNPDGSRAAIQFTDDGKSLNGPLNLIEVDESELIRTEYVPIQDTPRTFKEIIWQDVVTPAMRDLLYQAMMEGYDSLCNQLKTKAVPVLKAKTQSIMKDVDVIATGIKNGFVGKTPKALELSNKSVVIEPNYSSSVAAKQQKTVRSKEEIESIVHTMRVSAVTLAACIRMLNNTVMGDDGNDPQLRLEIQRNLQTLSANDVMRQIDLLLEDKNRALLDEEEFTILSSFRKGYFLVNEERISITRYLDK